MSKTTETKPVSDADRKAEEYRNKIERDEAIAAAKAEFLQKLADIGLTGNHVCTIFQNMHWQLEQTCKQYFQGIQLSDIVEIRPPHSPNN